jgi:hypothetical protein
MVGAKKFPILNFFFGNAQSSKNLYHDTIANYVSHNKLSLIQYFSMPRIVYRCFSLQYFLSIVYLMFSSSTYSCFTFLSSMVSSTRRHHQNKLRSSSLRQLDLLSLSLQLASSFLWIKLKPKAKAIDHCTSPPL